MPHPHATVTPVESDKKTQKSYITAKRIELFTGYEKRRKYKMGRGFGGCGSFGNSWIIIIIIIILLFWMCCDDQGIADC